MVNNQDEILTGQVIEALPNAMFKVDFMDDNEPEIVQLSGRMRRFRIRIFVGDKVEVKFDQYGGRGIIIKRI